MEMVNSIWFRDFGLLVDIIEKLIGVNFQHQARDKESIDQRTF